MLLLSRLIAASAYAGGAFLLGLSLGERGELGVVQTVFMVVIPLATIVLAIVSKRDGRAYVAATGLAMFGGLLLGQVQFERAWHECTTAGFAVRQSLAQHHATHDGYPSRLEELERDLPCRAGLRKTILHYLSNERGFRLWITNDRQTIFFHERGGTPAR